MAKKILTLDIGAATIALAEYEPARGGGLTLVNYGTATLAMPLDAGNAETVLMPALLGIVREKGMTPGEVAVSVSGQMVFPRFASIPAAGGADRFEQLVRYEIEQNVPFPIDEMICDRQVIGETETGDSSVLIVAAKAVQIEEIATALRAAGFMPLVIDVAPIAVTNVLRCLRGTEAGCSVILDIGAKTTSLVIADGDRLYMRSIPVAGNTITKELCQTFGYTPEEAESIKCESAYVALGGVVEDEDETRDRISRICRTAMTRLHAEVSRSVNFYRSQQGGSAPVKLYLTGGTSLLPQLDRFFAESLQIEVEYLNPFEQIGVGSKIDAAALETEGALLTATAGLALHVAGLAPFTINLVPPSIVNDRADAARIPFVAVAGAALLAALVAALLAVNRQTAVLQESCETVESRVSSLKSLDDRVKKAQAGEVQAAARADELRGLFEARVAPLVALNAVRSALGSEMWIEKWEGDRVTIRGWADDLRRLVERSKASGKSTASEIVADRLRALPQVDAESVQIAEMTTVGKDAPVEQFTVLVKFVKGGTK